MFGETAPKEKAGQNPIPVLAFIRFLIVVGKSVSNVILGRKPDTKQNPSHRVRKDRA